MAVTLVPEVSDPDAYLGTCDVIDLDHPEIRRIHAELVSEIPGVEDAVYRILVFVRDEVRHSADAGDHVVTLRASEVLAARTGLCYAKAHLAAALLRLSGVPTGLCYQLIRSKDRLVLHGLVAAHLAGDWHRFDVRGNMPGAPTEKSLGSDILPFQPDWRLGERDLPELLVRPAPSVVACLSGATDLDDVSLPEKLS